MQPMRTLERVLRLLDLSREYLFTLDDMGIVLNNHDRGALKMVASRAVAAGIFLRPCRGVYMLADAPRTGYEIFHIAGKLRAGYFNYISQETVLSEAGVIAQMPINRVTLMSSGSSAVFVCGNFGTIEFTHTRRNLDEVSSRLIYDSKCRMLRATVEIAREDLGSARRNLHLIDLEALNASLVR